MNLSQSPSLSTTTRTANVGNWLRHGLRTLFATLTVGLMIWGAAWAVDLVRHPSLTAGIGEAFVANNLEVLVDSVEWVGENHNHGGAEDPSNVTLAPDAPDEAAQAAVDMGFVMPRGMMPGIPEEGQQRLKIEVNFQNTGRRAKEISPHQFHVEADGQIYRPLDRAMTQGRELMPGQYMGLLVLIDVDEDVFNPVLVWENQGARVDLPLNGVPDHNDH